MLIVISALLTIKGKRPYDKVSSDYSVHRHASPSGVLVTKFASFIGHFCKCNSVPKSKYSAFNKINFSILWNSQVIKTPS